MALLLALALLFMGLAWALRSTRQEPGRRSRARNHTAQTGEREAEALLAAHGYRVVDRQVPATGTLWVDGHPEPFEVRVDLQVERGGRRWVAEVKTGRCAPDPAWPATRRQLREYAALFPDHGLLLVDAEGGEIYEVGFEGDDGDREAGPGR